MAAGERMTGRDRTWATGPEAAKLLGISLPEIEGLLREHPHLQVGEKTGLLKLDREGLLRLAAQSP
jgi:hypothetical protein